MGERKKGDLRAILIKVDEAGSVLGGVCGVRVAGECHGDERLRRDYKRPPRHLLSLH